jgi:hypothetical protein
MDALLRYRNRAVTRSDVEFIRKLIAVHPDESRRALSTQLCRAWNWTQPNGAPKDMVCRGLMLALHRAGHIELPPQRKKPLNPLARRVKPQPVETDSSPVSVSFTVGGAGCQVTVVLVAREIAGWWVCLIRCSPVPWMPHTVLPRGRVMLSAAPRCLCHSWPCDSPAAPPTWGERASGAAFLAFLAFSSHCLAKSVAPAWPSSSPEPDRQTDSRPTDTEVSLRELGALELRQVRRTPEEPAFNGLVQVHHYLGYTQPVGEHLKYIVYARERPVACFAWSSSPRHLGPRDHFIGWSAEARRRNIRFIAYNSRFLILPWVQVPHLASHLLGRMARILSDGWQKLYGHPIYLLETFVDPERFRGTCYRAANWVALGRTTGRGKNDQTHVPNRSLKEVLAYPVVEDFRERLSSAL